jgi:hypothetical protein
MASEKYKIALGAPGSTWKFDSVRSLFLASRDHDFTVYDSQCSGGNFNRLWTFAMNLGSAGKITHFAMLHADIIAANYWLDVLVRELDFVKGDLISAAVAIKDHRAVLSCGVGNPSNQWEPYRRLTVADLRAEKWNVGGEEVAFRKTFSAKMLGYSGFPLLHNNGCWVADMRKPIWYQTDANGLAPVFFRYNEEVRRVDGKWTHFQESEDWAFSRKLHAVTDNTFVTSAISPLHEGSMRYPAAGVWGTYTDGDRDTERNWKAEVVQC